MDQLRHRLEQRQQVIMDKLTPYVPLRWTIAVVLLGIFMIRIYVIEGFYIVAYGLGIYLLNMLIGFLSPRVDPEFAQLDDDEDADDAALPTSNEQEFKPFIRRLPEFKFWVSCVKATSLSLVLTIFPFLDIPVFWPILVVYFIGLFVMTMRKQIQHMIKHKYVPFSLGKPKYQAGGPSSMPAAPKRAD
eukprot:TRINITY_DN2834_c2_g1_i1.p1 TRINITY_DN2834_c2_g1~~TRINITY_DN2834_c2_g1_i1.p1  ORF type:complete len:200 (-),score=54.87 TRINITY_DN2834_c2_g1_i1:61-624(-)